jgi:hypothetical protein
MVMSHHHSEEVKFTMSAQEVFRLCKLSFQNYDEEAWFIRFSGSCYFSFSPVFDKERPPYREIAHCLSFKNCIWNVGKNGKVVTTVLM